MPTVIDHLDALIARIERAGNGLSLLGDATEKLGDAANAAAGPQSQLADALLRPQQRSGPDAPGYAGGLNAPGGRLFSLSSGDSSSTTGVWGGDLPGLPGWLWIGPDGRQYVLGPYGYPDLRRGSLGSGPSGGGGAGAGSGGGAGAGGVAGTPSGGSPAAPTPQSAPTIGHVADLPGVPGSLWTDANGRQFILGPYGYPDYHQGAPRGSGPANAGTGAGSPSGGPTAPSGASAAGGQRASSPLPGSPGALWVDVDGEQYILGPYGYPNFHRGGLRSLATTSAASGGGGQANAQAATTTTDTGGGSSTPHSTAFGHPDNPNATLPIAFGSGHASSTDRPDASALFVGGKIDRLANALSDQGLFKNRTPL